MEKVMNDSRARKEVKDILRKGLPGASEQMLNNIVREGIVDPLRIGIKPNAKAPLRNSQCPCKSGLKFKRCCGLAKQKIEARSIARARYGNAHTQLIEEK